MRKYVLETVTVLALFAATGVVAQAAVVDQSTWRWSVSLALDAQRAHDRADEAALAAAEFRQNYERYSPTGVLETRR